LVKGDLSPLFAIDVGDAAFAAVTDVAIKTTDSESSGVRDRSRPRPYFNGGVLVIDIPRWRSSGLGERALQYATATDEPLPWVDQDALNAVAGEWRELDYVWNFQSAQLSAQDPRLYRRAAVVHFTGQKPWRGSCTTRGATAWVRSLLASGWYTRGAALRWLLRYLAQRLRFLLGTARQAVLRS
jgi:lipopolysaccharide biosynthesis glycosyltransferase